MMSPEYPGIHGSESSSVLKKKKRKLSGDRAVTKSDMRGFLFNEDGRAVQKTQFQEVEETKEYCETHYFENPRMSSYKTLVRPNPFWAELAADLAAGKASLTLSPNFIYASNSTTELAAALALIDLPCQSTEQIFEAQEGRQVAIKGKSNFMLFRKEVKEATQKFGNELLVIHRFFDCQNPNSEQEIKEFLVDEVYGCQIIITNVSNSAKDFSVLWQIPEGSLPLGLTTYQKSVPCSLAPYTTMKFDFKFYFPVVPADG